MATTKKTSPEPTDNTPETGEFVPPTPEIVESSEVTKPEESVETKTKVEKRKEADKKAKAENRPTGSAEKVEKKKEVQYVMIRNVKYNGTIYEVDQAVELDGEMKTLFLKNGFCKMQ